MEITVRLYRQHDMDLITMYRTKGVRFQKEMKAAVRAWTSGSEYHIARPENAQIKAGYVPKVIQIHISLDRKDDAAEIKKLRSIRYGYRGSFLKGLFRQYLTSEPLDGYLDRDDLIFESGITPVQQQKKRKKQQAPGKVKVEKFSSEKIKPDRKAAEKAVDENGEKLYAPDGSGERNTGRPQQGPEDALTEKQKGGNVSRKKDAETETAAPAPSAAETVPGPDVADLGEYNTAPETAGTDTGDNSGMPDLFGEEADDGDGNDDYEELMKAMNALAH